MALRKEEYYTYRDYLTWPDDVRFTADEDTDTVFQPDVIVVCDKDKIDEKGIVGAPDLVIEIISKSTAKNDRGVKYEVYEKEGVREYWIVDPDGGIIETYTLSDGGVFKRKAYLASGPVPVHIFGGELEINIGHLIDA